MSVSLVLVPLAVAAVSAWQSSRQETNAHGQTVCHVQTRMKDPRLLEAALVDTVATVTRTPDALVANWGEVTARFTRDQGGVWEAHFSGDIDVEHASAIVASLDLAYGRQVQQEVLRRLRTQAPVAGMAISSERLEKDGSVTLVLDVGVRA